MARMNALMHGLVLSCLLLHSALGYEDCLRRDGAPYLGTQHVAADGLSCLNWREVQKTSLFPSPVAAAEDHNYCRNVEEEPVPSCYVTGKRGMPERRPCSIQPCPVRGAQRHKATLEELQDVEGDTKQVYHPADLMTSRSAPGTVQPEAGISPKEQAKSKESNPVTSTARDTLSPTAVAGNPQDAEPDNTRVFESADLLPARGESAAVQPVIGISQRVRVKPKEKKDLGTLGYVLGVLMMVIIIAIGSGIVVGYIYKRGRDLKKQREQTVYEREMQRITLPLSAFTNPSCEIVDENTIVVHASQTPVEEGLQEGDVPLMGQTGTPGA
ncbi:phosphoinositide-3-kinase-interacting protein 1 [Lissotriton helveticus]